jgi:hypothetical protein
VCRRNRRINLHQRLFDHKQRISRDRRDRKKVFCADCQSISSARSAIQLQEVQRERRKSNRTISKNAWQNGGDIGDDNNANNEEK